MWTEIHEPGEKNLRVLSSDVENAEMLRTETAGVITH